MQVARKNLNATIQQLIQNNPHNLPQIADPKAYELIRPPYSFYNQHVDDRLALKRVAPFPSLQTNLSKAVDIAFENFHKGGREFPTSGSHILVRPDLKVKEVVDGRGIFNVYKTSTADYLHPLTSMLALHPDAKLWTTSLAFENRKLSHCLRPNCWTIHENACLVFRQDPEGDPHADAGGMLPAAEAWASMDPTKRALYDHAKRLFPELANFHFYCEGDELAVVGLRSMDQLMSKPFHHESTTSAPGCLPSDTGVHVPLDAVNTAWGTPVKTFDTGRRKSSRIASRKRTGLKGTSQWSKVTLPDATQSHSDPDNVSRAMLLYAWSRAVELDATYILIRCANYERIGFRHRESQTLYLSDLIHVPTCSDPNYSKLHLGLYLSIIEDVLDRTSQVIQKDPPLANDLPVTVETNAMLNNDKKKRKRNCPDEPTVPAPMRKRPRTRALAAQDEARKVAAEKTLMDIQNEIQGRPGVLLRIQYSHYNSLIPSAFLTISDPSSPSASASPHPQPSTKPPNVLNPKDYIILTLTSPIGDGSTGHTHKATLEFLDKHGKPRKYPGLIVKLAFHKGPYERLNREYKVYQHLRKSGVTVKEGIPHVFGFYRDWEIDDAAILVMSDVGKGLWERPIVNRRVQVTSEERANYIKILQSIHSAGVRHRDIRSMNMAVDREDDGSSVSIFDFDMADVNASVESREREMGHLIDILDGRLHPWTQQQQRASVGSKVFSNDPVEYEEVPVVYENELVKTLLR